MKKVVEEKRTRRKKKLKRKREEEENDGVFLYVKKIEMREGRTQPEIRKTVQWVVVSPRKYHLTNQK